MKAMTENDHPNPNVSAYLKAGAPLNCFLPSCQQPFAGTCVHGKDHRFYCSSACAEEGKKIDLTHVEDIKRKRG